MASREVCAASGDGIKESLWALIELISVSRSNGKAGTLWLSSGTNPRWKKVCPIFIEEGLLLPTNIPLSAFHSDGAC